MRAAARALHRSRQFFGALRPHIEADLREEAFALLSEPERRLFETMSMRDQQHCLDVYRRLRAQRHDDPDLLAASLLHDVGKGRIALWQRAAYVLLAARAPGLLSRLAAPGEGRGWPAVAGWRHALYRCRHHPEIGAELARQAGSSHQVVALIRSDERASSDERLRALRAADDAA